MRFYEINRSDVKKTTATGETIDFDLPRETIKIDEAVKQWFDPIIIHGHLQLQAKTGFVEKIGRHPDGYKAMQETNGPWGEVFYLLRMPEAVLYFLVTPLERSYLIVRRDYGALPMWALALLATSAKKWNPPPEAPEWGKDYVSPPYTNSDGSRGYNRRGN